MFLVYWFCLASICTMSHINVPYVMLLRGMHVYDLLYESFLRTVYGVVYEWFFCNVFVCMHEIKQAKEVCAVYIHDFLLCTLKDLGIDPSLRAFRLSRGSQFSQASCFLFHLRGKYTCVGRSSSLDYGYTAVTIKQSSLHRLSSRSSR